MLTINLGFKKEPIMKKEPKKTILFTSILMGTLGISTFTFADPNCPTKPATDWVPSQEQIVAWAADGQTCTWTGTSYSGGNPVAVTGDGSILIFTNPVTVSGGTISNSQTHTISIGGGNIVTTSPGSTLIAEEKLTVNTSPYLYSTGIFITGSDVNKPDTLITKNGLEITSNADTTDHGKTGLQLDGIGAFANLYGTTLIKSETGVANGIRNFGTINFLHNETTLIGNATINSKNNTAIRNDYKITSDQLTQLNIATESLEYALINNGNSAEFIVNGDLNISSTNAITNTNRASFRVNGENVNITGNVNNDDSIIEVFNRLTNITGVVTNKNNGLINLSNGVVGGNLLIDGNYIGDNGLIKIDTQIDARSESDKSLTDFIEITGDLSGTTNIEVNNVGGIGGGLNKGIHIIETKTSTASGISESTPFILDDDNYLSAGKYVYSLELRKQEEKDNAGTTTLHDNWYIVTHKDEGEDTFTPDIGSYTANEVIGNTLFNMRLEDREGASQYQSLGDNDKGNTWIRMYGNHQQFKSMGDQLKTKGDSFVTQIGAGLVTLGEENQYNLGAMAGYGHYSGKTNSQVVNLQSKSKINGYSLGLYGTWYAHPVEKRGAYIDSWVLWNKFKNTIDTADQHQYKYDSSGITASIEAGGDYLINENGKRNWWIQPQGQLTYQGVKMDEFYDAQGIKISHASPNFQARLGFKTYLEIPSSKGAFTNYRPYVALNYIHNTSEYAVNVANEEISAQGFKNLGEIKLGVEGNIAKNSYVWANTSYVAGSHSNQTIQGNIGWKYNF